MVSLKEFYESPQYKPADKVIVYMYVMNRPLQLKQIYKTLGIDKHVCWRIMKSRDLLYGWIRKVDIGIYELTKKGRKRAEYLIRKYNIHI